MEEYCRKLDEAINHPEPGRRLELAARVLADCFAVRDHEVGLFQLDDPGRTATFLWPPQHLGSTLKIPIKLFTTSLVSATAQKLHGSIDNAFASTPHLHMFEQTLTEQEHRLPLQKIMTAPGVKDGRLRWIVQISRKGRTLEEAGPDFTSDQLRRLEALAGCLANLPSGTSLPVSPDP